MISFGDIARFFEEIEMRLISSLKRNLSRHKQEEKEEGFEWSAWQAEKLRSVDRFRKENADIVGEYTDVIDNETRELMQEQFHEGERLAEETIKKALGTDASEKISAEPVSQFFGVDSNKVDSLIQDITTLEKNVETAALRMTDDVYRQTLHRTQLALSTGSMTLEQAIDISVKDFLDKGINCIVYKDGRRVNIADYVRMALRTTQTRAKLQGMSKRAREMGYDTVIVSQYSMCSDTCLPWQGRVYIEDMFVLWDGEIEERNGGELWGKSHYCGKWFPLLSTAVHKGLFHPNCRHSITVWIEGVNIPPPELDDAEVRKRSELEQKQRALEREVRKAKRKVKGLSDPENIRKAKDELKAAQKKLEDFINKVNAEEGATVLKRDDGKEKIYTADEQKSVDESASQRLETEHTDISVSKKPIEPFTKRYTEVQDEYEKSATPEMGTVTRDDLYDEKSHKDEIDFADWLHKKYGGDIHLIEEKGKPDGEKSPDYIWNYKLWDLKTVSTEKAANGAIRRGYNQIEHNPGGVILNFGDNDISIDILLQVIEKRMKWYEGEPIDIMLVNKGEVIKVLRYKK